MNRSERRKNPDQWWEIVAFSRPSQEVEVAGGPPVYLRGNVRNATVVQLPDEVSNMAPQEQSLFMEGLAGALKGAGIGNAIIVPKGVEFVGFRPVSPDKAKELSFKLHSQQLGGAQGGKVH